MNKYEELVDLYLRLNGFFTVRNFVLHPPRVRTDVDVFGVRFPFQSESLLGNALANDQTLGLSDSKVDVILAEVKKDSPHLNRTWRDEARVRYALEFLGLFRGRSELDEAARVLASSRTFEHSNTVIRVMLFSGHGRIAQDLLNRRLDRVLEFVARRFGRYKPLKTYHPMWSGLASQLFQIVATRPEPLTLNVLESLSCND